MDREADERTNRRDSEKMRKESRERDTKKHTMKASEEVTLVFLIGSIL